MKSQHLFFLFILGGLLQPLFAQENLLPKPQKQPKRFQLLGDLSYSQTLFNMRTFHTGNGPSPYKLLGQELGLGLELRGYLGQKQRHFLGLQAGYRLRRLSYKLDFASVGVFSNIDSRQLEQVFLFDKLALRLGYNYRFNIPLAGENLGLVLGLGLAFDPYLRARAARGSFMQTWRGYAHLDFNVEYHENNNGEHLSNYNYNIRIMPDKVGYAGLFFNLGFEYPLQNRLVHLGLEMHRYAKNIEELSVTYRSSRTGLNGSFDHNQRYSLRLRLALSF